LPARYSCFIALQPIFSSFDFQQVARPLNVCGWPRV